MNTETQDELIAEMQRFATLAERLAAEIRRLTANVKKDLAECIALAGGTTDENDRGSD